MHPLNMSRYTNRQQDRMAWIDRKGPFQKAFNEVELTVTRLMHGWLQSPRNGSTISHIHPTSVC